MFFRYEIFVKGVSTGFKVYALTDNSARDKYFNQQVGVTRYSGVNYNDIEAVRI